ncbi:MAG TPA: hypothetical protein VKA68_18910 [bacterium]|nr:hypothetical protein [bacterium]
MRELTYDEMAEIRGGWSKSDTINVLCNAGFWGVGAANSAAFGYYMAATTVLSFGTMTLIGLGIGAAFSIGGSIACQAFTS